MSQLIETASPWENLDGFRRSLGEFATGVTVIATSEEGVPYGMTSNSFASVSLRPPLVLWSLRRESQSFAAFEACGHFAVSVLASDQIELSQRFARSGPDKFAGVDFRPGEGGSPVLANVAASFECRRTGTFDGGDHLIMLGEVIRYSRFDRSPLLFAKGRYAITAEHPSTRLTTIINAAQEPRSDDTALIASLMVQVYGAFASQLQKDRQAVGLGLSMMQARLLKATQNRPGNTLEQLLPELLLDFNGSQGVLDTLVGMGLLVVDDAQRLVLTPAGSERIHLIEEHTRDSERTLFRNIAPEDVSTVRRVLQTIISELG